jgi:peptide/nickel transport system permease protein
VSTQRIQGAVFGLMEERQHHDMSRESGGSLKLRVGLGIVGIFLLLAAFAPLLAPYGPDSQDLLHQIAGPGAGHLLGTDGVGRDVLSRLIYATRTDLPVAAIAVLIPALIGTSAGLIAGYYGPLADTTIMRSADLVLAFPVYVLVLALIAVMGPGAKSIVVASAIVDWVVYARLVRGEVLRVKTLDYITAARAGGLSDRKILVSHILPNVIAQPVIYVMSDMVLLILALSALSFLGVGIPSPTAEWGNMISEVEPFLRVRPWLILPPGLAIVTIGIGFSLIGDALADRWSR